MTQDIFKQKPEYIVPDNCDYVAVVCIYVKEYGQTVKRPIFVESFTGEYYQWMDDFFHNNALQYSNYLIGNPMEYLDLTDYGKKVVESQEQGATGRFVKSLSLSIDVMSFDSVQEYMVRQSEGRESLVFRYEDNKSEQKASKLETTVEAYTNDLAMDFSFHKRPIVPEGVLGEFSKIEEEVDEMREALEQKNRVLVLIEMLDLLGAVDLYAQKQYNLTLREMVEYVEPYSQFRELLKKANKT